MIKDLSKLAWRIGISLIIAVPLIHIAAIIAPILIGQGEHPVVQLIFLLQTLVPSILLTIGGGCALCLLVRIEERQRADQVKGE